MLKKKVMYCVLSGLLACSTAVRAAECAPPGLDFLLRAYREDGRDTYERSRLVLRYMFDYTQGRATGGIEAFKKTTVHRFDRGKFENVPNKANPVTLEDMTRADYEEVHEELRKTKKWTYRLTEKPFTSRVIFCLPDDAFGERDSELPYFTRLDSQLAAQKAAAAAVIAERARVALDCTECC